MARQLEADVSGSRRSMQDRLEDLKGTETTATLSKIIRGSVRSSGGIARDQGEPKSEVEKVQAWLDRQEADASENLRNMHARPEDLRGAEKAATLPSSSRDSVRSLGRHRQRPGEAGSRSRGDLKPGLRFSRAATPSKTIDELREKNRRHHQGQR